MRKQLLKHSTFTEKTKLVIAMLKDTGFLHLTMYCTVQDFHMYES